MAQIKIQGKKQIVAVFRDGQQVARIHLRLVRNPKTGKVKRVLGGPVKLIGQAG